MFISLHWRIYCLRQSAIQRTFALCWKVVLFSSAFKDCAVWEEKLSLEGSDSKHNLELSASLFTIYSWVTRDTTGGDVMHFKAGVRLLTARWCHLGSQGVLRASSPLKTKTNLVIKVRSSFRIPNLNTRLTFCNIKMEDTSLRLINMS